MIDFSTLKFGDKIYNINDSLNAFYRKKITTVIDGVEWYRYDVPLREYTIEVFTYVGRYEPSIFGEVIPEDVEETKYFIRNDRLEEMAYLHSDDADDNDWFVSNEEAIREINERIEDDKRIDRS